MGKGNKNKNRNAFYFFMLDFKEQHGRSFKSMDQVAQMAGPHWKNLTPQQRKKYEDMAKRSKETQEKQTTVGESVDKVLQEQQEKAEFEKRMKENIEKHISKLVNTNTIADEYFYLMHINYFCYHELNHKFYPAEIALGKFNLRYGIIKDDVYHKLITPGRLPIGFSALARAYSEETHQLPIPNDDSENNTEEVFMDIISKLSENADLKNLPKIYVSDNVKLVTENVLSTIKPYEYEDIAFDIYSLQYLLYCLKNSISTKTGIAKVWPTVSVSKIQLEKDVYDFCEGITCSYHDNSDMPIYCSLSQIMRQAYIVCDNCVADLNIELILGQHVPKNASIKVNKLQSAREEDDEEEEEKEQQQQQEQQQRFTSYAPSTSASSSRYYTDMASEADTTTLESEKSYHGFSSGESQEGDDEEEWKQPRRNRRLNTAAGLSQQSDMSSRLSQDSTFVPSRRPVAQSAAGLAKAFDLTRVGRGRGRGVFSRRPPTEDYKQ